MDLVGSGGRRAHSTSDVDKESTKRAPARAKNPQSLGVRFLARAAFYGTMAHPRPDAADTAPSDASLVADAARGRADAIAGLYARHAKNLLAVAYRLLQRREDAEDVVHDVFVGLPEALRRYEERGSLGAWLRTITARTALMRLRERGARAHVALNERALATPTATSDAALTLDHALRTLSPALRAVLVLKEIEGFSHAEIAELLHISVGASEVRLHRALRALRTALHGQDGR